MTAKSLLLVGVLATGGAGCGGEQHDTPRPSQIDPPPRDDYAAAAALWKTSVMHGDFVRRTLYTWTTADQIAELRTARVLLTREESPEKGASYFEQVIHALAGRGVPLAKLLDTSSFAKSRFAWPSPWATRGGWAGEQYGDQLIRITLRPEAIVLALSTVDMTFRAQDLTGAAVAEAEVLAHPERIGAVFFTADAEHPAAPAPRRNETSYREFVVNNESMIESWSVGTADILAEVAAETDALSALARGLAAHAPSQDVRHAFAGALAFDNPSYILDHDRIASLANTLRATPKVAALEGGGDAKWPGLGVARTPPRVKKPVPRGTYGTFGTY